jgi:hypothetical protein
MNPAVPALYTTAVPSYVLIAVQLCFVVFF